MPLGGFAREVAAWLGYVDLKHGAGKLIQRITKGTHRATEAWTDGRQAEDDKYVELQYELAVALANATEGAWSLKVAEYEHQFKVIDEAQKIFAVRKMMPKNIKRKFLTGPRKFDEIMEKREITVNEIMADDGPAPTNLWNARTTQSDQDASNDMSYDDVCAIAWNGYKAGKGAPRMDQKE